MKDSMNRIWTCQYDPLNRLAGMGCVPTGG